MNRASILPIALVALAACTPDFDPASRVEKLRVLAVQAEPPEIAPPPASGAPAAPDRAALTSFVLRADFATAPGRETTVLYLACVPAPGDPTPSPCVLFAQLSDPAAVLAAAASAACAAPAHGQAAPIAFAGVEVCQAPDAGSPVPWKTCGVATVRSVPLPAPELAVPAGYGFDALPPGAPERILGVQAVVLAFAIDATPDELATGPGACPAELVARRLAALWGEREHVLSTKRVSIRGPDAPDPPNVNPALDGVAADGAVLDPGAASGLPRGAVALAPVLPAAADHQPYTELDATGAPIRSRVEEWIYSWFGTTGEMDDLHTRDGGVEQWDLAAAAGGPAVVAAVVRDLRGGVAWRWAEVTIAP